MDHATVKKNLSAYLDGAVTPEEKALIVSHLESCADCRAALHELAETVSRLRDLGEVEPPPWLTVKVMARVREEAGRERGFFSRLFFPLGWKLPLEAAALVCLTVTGYLVYHAVSPEVGPVVPIVSESREEPSAIAPQAAVPRKPSEEWASRKESSGKIELPFDASRERDKRDAVKAQRGSEPSQLPSDEVANSVPGAPSMEAAGRMQEKKEEASRSFRENAGSAPKRDQDIRLEKPAPSPGLRAKSLAPSAAGRMRLMVVVEDRDAALRDIEVAARKSGGKAVRGESGGGGEGAVVVHVDRTRLREFLDRLSGIGDIREQAQLPNGDETVVDVVIEVHGG